MNKTKESEIVRDWLTNEIKLINSSVLSDDAKEKVIEERSQTAMFSLAHIWIGDLKFK